MNSDMLKLFPMDLSDRESVVPLDRSSKSYKGLLDATRKEMVRKALVKINKIHSDLMKTSRCKIFDPDASRVVEKYIAGTPKGYMAVNLNSLILMGLLQENDRVLRNDFQAICAVLGQKYKRY